MPLYEYAIIQPDGSDGATFEVLQTYSEPALTVHPDTGEPVRRLIGAPNAPKRWADANGRAVLSNENLSRHGFTKYQNAGGGVYEKTAGVGPDTISRD